MCGFPDEFTRVRKREVMVDVATGLGQNQEWRQLLSWVRASTILGGQDQALLVATGPEWPKACGQLGLCKERPMGAHSHTCAAGFTR